MARPTSPLRRGPGGGSALTPLASALDSRSCLSAEAAGGASHRIPRSLPTLVMVTLHSYFFRELLKTFALASVALTALLTMGGSLYTFLRFEGLEARDIPMLTPLLLPVMAAVSMAVAGLFSASMTYGRFANDNELTACRAAGINVHRLLLSALVLGLFVSLVALAAVNVMIPRIVAGIESYARNNLGVLAAKRLEARTFLDFINEGGDWHLLTTDRVERPAAAELRAKHFDVDPRIHYLLVHNPRYLQRGPHNELERFIAAELGFCVFDTRTNPISLQVTVKNAQQFEPGTGSIFVEEQPIGPFQISFGTKLRSSLVDLPTLFGWLREPWNGGRVREEFQNFIADLMRHRFAQFARSSLEQNHVLELYDDVDSRFRIKCDAVDETESGLLITGVGVDVIRSDGAPLKRLEAQRGALLSAAERSADLLAGPRKARNQVTVRLRLLETADQPVREIDPRASGEPLLRAAYAIDKLKLPTEVEQSVSSILPSQIVDPDADLPLPTKLSEARLKLCNRARDLRFDVLGLIHLRFAMALAVLISILIAATLGAAFRGAQALSAFGLACIPAFLVALVIYFGKDLAQRPSSHEAGLWLMWGGLFVICGLELIMLRSMVRR